MTRNPWSESPASLTPKEANVDTRSIQTADEYYDRSPSTAPRPADHHAPSYFSSNSFHYQSGYPPTYHVGSHYDDRSEHIPLQQRDHGGNFLNADVSHAPGAGDVSPMPRSSRWKKPWACWIISLVQVIVFIAQLGHSWKLTGLPIQVKPSFNPLIGPSVYNSINMGARYPLCMKFISNVTDVVTGYPCPDTTSTAQLSACTLATLCGNGAQDGTQLTQWWRFISPIFLHAGLIHVAFNLLVQLRLGTMVELEIGSTTFAPIYLASGIAGFLFGGNFAGEGLTSVGASGALFGIFALNLLTLLYHWSQIERPARGLIYILIDMIISFVLGLLPGVDNFSHIGGWIFGMLLGVAFLRSPDALDRRQNPYHKTKSSLKSRSNENTSETSGMSFLEGRRPGWYALALLRAICLTLALLSFILLIKVCN